MLPCRNAQALGNALLVCMLVPWFLCFLFYTGEIKWIYTSDCVPMCRRVALFVGLNCRLLHEQAASHQLHAPPADPAVTRM